MKSWQLAIRPKTLTAAIVPVMVGSALAYSEKSSFSLLVFSCTILAALFIQIATNLFNDAIDFKKGADTEERLGPQRVTQSQLMSAKSVYGLAFACCILAVLFGLPLVFIGGWPIVAIGVVSLFLAYAYTGGPFPLAYRGAGDFFVILFFGLIAVCGVYYLHTQSLSPLAIVAGLQIGFLATVLIVINNLRDADQDKKVNKNTLAVRFGEKFARFEALFLVAGSFLLGAFWVYQSYWLVALLPLTLLPLSKNLMVNLFKTSPGVIYNQFLANAAVLHLLFGIQISLGLLLHEFIVFPL